MLRALDQNDTPLFDAVKKYVESNVVQFHVPGHKQGQGLKEFREFVGENVLKMDANGMEDLDYVNSPTGVIKEAEKLLAQSYGAQDGFFLVNGTTIGVQAMIMSACQQGDKIIIPRNAHKSTIGGIILSGAIPLYIQPKINDRLGFSMGIDVDSLKRVIEENPHARAVLLMNPTYYGAVSDLKSVVRIAHRNNMAVLVDEAHGAHMRFHNDFPLTAMEVGADMSSISMHKTAGSLTQSSALLIRGDRIMADKVKEVLNLTYTSSASYLLMTSIDVARKQMAIDGNHMLENTLKLVRQARSRINEIDGFYAFGKELIGTPGVYDFDETKLGIHIEKFEFTGYQLESILRKNYNIQIELADTQNVLAICTIGDKEENFNRLVDALNDISKKYNKTDKKNKVIIPENPKMIVSPRDAFYSPKKTVKLEDSVGEIAGEMIMAYPPGIPVVCMGEKISKDIVEYIKFLKSEKCELQGTVDEYVNYIRILGL